MINSITPNLMVESVEETVSFYKNVLDFSLVDSVEKNGNLDFAIMINNNLVIMFQRRQSLIDEYPTLDVEKVKPSISLYIKVSSLEDLYEEIKSKTEILKDFYTTFYNTKEFAIRDNNGYILTLASE